MIMRKGQTTFQKTQTFQWITTRKQFQDSHGVIILFVGRYASARIALVRLKNSPSEIAVTFKSAHSYRPTHASFSNIIECSVFSNASSPDNTSHSLSYLKRFFLTRVSGVKKFHGQIGAYFRVSHELSRPRTQCRIIHKAL